MKRLNKFLNAEEVDEDAIQEERDGGEPVQIENATFSWEPETTCLRNINLKVKEGSLIGVVGVVGSGKSSLLSAMLGEMIKINGRVKRRGKLAYVAQQAWIQNCSLRDNVLFGEDLNDKKYSEVIECCALMQDLEILQSGDKTEIGKSNYHVLLFHDMI
jgi:ABC-type bacteriocin/lantibiotic exporter with double-glycine peptidase domain